MFHIYLFYGQFFYATCNLFFIRTIFPQSGSGFGLGFALELGLRAIFVVDNFPRTVHGSLYEFRILQSIQLNHPVIKNGKIVWKVQTSQLSRFHFVLHGFNRQLTVSRQGLHFFISFYKFKWIFSQTHNFLRKQTRQHNPFSKNIAASSSTYRKISTSVIFDLETSTRSSPGNDCPITWDYLFILEYYLSIFKKDWGNFPPSPLLVALQS